MYAEQKRKLRPQAENRRDLFWERHKINSWRFSPERLLKYLSESKPGAFTLFAWVRLTDMIPSRANWSAPGQAEQIFFHSVLCREDEVLAVTRPCFFLPNGNQQYLAPEELASLRESGLTFCYDILNESEDLEWDPVPTGWKFPNVPVPRELYSS